MPFIGKNPTSGFSTIIKDDLTADGSTTAFTLSKQVASANDVAVFVGNVRQEPTDAYSVNGTTLTMTAAPASGINFYVLHIAGTLESSVIPADNTISTTKIQSNAITTAKLASSLDFSSITVSGLALGGGLRSIQTFTSNGTWTKPSGVNLIKVYVTGGGGGGGAGGGTADFGAGGGAGGTAIEIIDVTSVSSVSVTVGAGGSNGGGQTTTNGSAGGSSSFGSYCSATGGGGGINGNAGPVYGGAGGTATGGNINLTGGRGVNGFDNSDMTTTWASGIAQGGGSFWGGGGHGNYGGSSQPTNAQDAQVPGAGGGGAFYISAGGGDGAAGIVVVEEYS